MSDLFQKQHTDCKSHFYRDSKKLGSARRHFRERKRERERGGGGGGGGGE